MKEDNRRIERAIFIGEESEHTAKVFDALKLPDFRLDVCYVKTSRELVIRCCDFEPAIIMFDMFAASVNTYAKVKEIKSIGRLPSIAFSPCGSDAYKRIAEEIAPKMILIGTGSVKKDALLLEDALTLILHYPEIDNYPKVRNNLVTVDAWFDPMYERWLSPEGVSAVLEKLGVRKNLAGHKYLVCAICVQRGLRGFIRPIVLYNTVACEYGTTMSAVEKAIRYAIETAWVNGDIYTQHRLFGLSIDDSKGKPTNAEFIARLALEFTPK